MALNLLLMVVDLWVLGLLAFGLHRLSSRYGLVPLLLFFATLAAVLALTSPLSIYVRVAERVALPVTSYTVLPVMLLIVLILYVAEGSVSARLAILGTLAFYGLVLVTIAVLRTHLSLPGGGSYAGVTLSDPALMPIPRVEAASLAALVADLVTITVVYQLAVNHWRRVGRVMAVGLGLLASLLMDAFVFRLLASTSWSMFVNTLPADMAFKMTAALLLWPLAAYYLTRVASALPGFQGIQNRPATDVLFGEMGHMELALTRSEAALRESEERYRQVVENLDQIFWLMSADTAQIIYMSPTFEYILGHPVAPVYEPGFTWRNYVHPDDWENLFVGLGQRRDGVVEQEVRFIRRDGELRWIRVRSFPIRDAGGEIFRVAGVGQDVTNQRETEAALRESEARYAQLAATIDVAFWLLDVATSEFIYISPAIARISGHPPVDFYVDPQLVLTITHPDDRDYVTTQNRSQGDVDSENEAEFRIVHPDGEIRWVRTHSFPVRDSDGVVYRLAGSAQDVTARKLAEIALRESEERYRQLTENIDEVFWLIEVDPWETIYISPSISGLTGRSQEDFLNDLAVWAQIVHPEDLPRMAAWRETWAQGESEIEFRMVHVDGTLRWVWARVFPVFNEQGERYRVAGIARDITADKKAEEQRTELVVERERVRLLREFISDVSHDLKTPLSVILAKAHVIKHLNDPERQASHWEILETQVRRLDELIDDLLTMSRLDTVDDFTREALIFNRVVSEVCAGLMPLATRRGIEMVLDLETRSMPMMANGRELTRALANIVENAIYYTERGGWVTVRSRLIGETAEVVVSDTGVGISEEALPHIFERFYRADPSRPGEKGGTGLGLAIAHRVVELHSGDIGVISMPGEGTTFTVRLPVMLWMNASDDAHASES